MKKRFISYIIITLLSSISLTSYSNTREKVVVVDMDDVFVKPHRWSIKTSVFTGITPYLPYLGWRMLTSRRFRKCFKQARSNNKQDNILISVARIHKPLRKKVDSLLTGIHTKRGLIPDVIEFLKELKNQGYTIIVATNRHRIGFELTAKKLKFDQLYNGSKLFDAVVVGGSADFEEKTTIKGKRFSRLTYDHTLDNYITVADSCKPDKEYYQVVRNVVDQYVASHQDKFDVASPEIIFFDDCQENIEGANSSGLMIQAYQVPDKAKGLSMRCNFQQHLGLVVS